MIVAKAYLAGATCQGGSDDELLSCLSKPSRVNFYRLRQVRYQEVPFIRQTVSPASGCKACAKSCFSEETVLAAETVVAVLAVATVAVVTVVEAVAEDINLTLF